MAKNRVYSRYTIAAASLLGNQIRIGRIQHKWIEQELAERGAQTWKGCCN